MIKIGKSIVNDERILTINFLSETSLIVYFIGRDPSVTIELEDAESEFDRLTKFFCGDCVEAETPPDNDPLAILTPTEVKTIAHHLAEGKRYYAMDMSDKTVYAYRYRPELKRGASEWTPAAINDGDIVDGQFARFPLDKCFDAVTERFVEPQEK